MYYVIKTQYLENYGVFDEPAQPRWKAKGGDTYLLYRGVSIADPHRMLKNFIAEVCVKHSTGSCTYPVGEPVEILSHPTVSYEWCAEEINEPWFKFVNVTSVNTWDIQSVDVEENLYMPMEMFDEWEIKNALVNKIQQLTEDADG
jgi:hypothetical protein